MWILVLRSLHGKPLNQKKQNKREKLCAHRADRALGHDGVKTAQEAMCRGWRSFSPNRAGTGNSANAHIQVSGLSYSVSARSLSSVEVVFTEIQGLPISSVGFSGF